MVRDTSIFFCFVILSGWCTYAWADQASESAFQSAIGTHTKGRISLQLVSGALFSLTGLPEGSPVLNYAQTNLRLGWMLTNPGPQRDFLRGNWEGLFEITNSIIFKGFGNYIGGVTGLLRYNFVQPDWPVVPYIQGGVGIVYNDVYKDKTQRPSGRPLSSPPSSVWGFIICLPGTGQ